MQWLDGNATFASIRGSGHLAPLNRPHASLTLFRSFVLNTPLPSPPPSTTVQERGHGVA